MTLGEARAAALQTLRRHGLDRWSFRFDHARQRVGACFYVERAISLSRNFVEQNDEDAVLDTIRHEVAHALAWEHERERGHGAAWRKWCQATGATPRRCYQAGEVQLPAARYRCEVLRTEVRWRVGSWAFARTGVARTSLPRGAVFGRHRLSRTLREAVRVGLVSVFDTKTGRWVEG